MVEFRFDRVVHLTALACLVIVWVQAELAMRANERLGEGALIEVTILHRVCSILGPVCVAWLVVSAGGDALAHLALALEGGLRGPQRPDRPRTDFVETDDWEAGQCWACHDVRPLVRCMPCGDRSCCHACVTGWLGSNPTFACLTCRKAPATVELPALAPAKAAP